MSCLNLLENVFDTGSYQAIISKIHALSHFFQHVECIYIKVIMFDSLVKIIFCGREVGISIFGEFQLQMRLILVGLLKRTVKSGSMPSWYSKVHYGTCL